VSQVLDNQQLNNSVLMDSRMSINKLAKNA